MRVDFGGIGSGVQDLFGGIGSLKEADAYKLAGKYAAQNAVIAGEAGQIKLEQANRAVYKTLGAQAAGYGAAGLTSGGSAQEVLRDSVMQGSLEKAIIGEQTQINVTGYKAQAAQFQGMAGAAKSAGIGGILGGIAKVAGAIFAFSDRRLKTDIEQVGAHGPLGIYRFRFIDEDTQRVGVMADEVAIHAPHALGPEIGGYATVDYGKLGLEHLLEAA